MNRDALIACCAALLLALSTAPCAQEADPGPDGILGPLSGAEIYAQICQGCHMADGRGAQGGGSYPALAGNPTLASADYTAATILFGRRNMPAFAGPVPQTTWFPPTWLSDAQVAAVVNHIRNGFGNQWQDTISAEQVKALRER